VFVADHFVRPVLIGGSTRLPFVWVLLGILGGVETFGLLGLLLGPALLAVLIALWRELAAPEITHGDADLETQSPESTTSP
jgi:predicted PurR-regulated permease PerM